MSKVVLEGGFLEMFLPKLLIEHFKLIKTENKINELHFYYVEKNIVPPEYESVKLHSKGFYTESTVQDFPIRGKSVYLHITRRKWKEIDTGTTIKRDWKLVAKGTRMTSEFATFLKGMHM